MKQELLFCRAEWRFPDSLVATVQDDKGIWSNFWTVSGLWQIAVCTPSSFCTITPAKWRRCLWFLICLYFASMFGLELATWFHHMAELGGGKGSIPEFPPVPSFSFSILPVTWEELLLAQNGPWGDKPHIAITHVHWEAKLGLAQWSPGYLYCMLEEKQTHTHSIDGYVMSSRLEHLVA